MKKPPCLWCSRPIDRRGYVVLHNYPDVLEQALTHGVVECALTHHYAHDVCEPPGRERGYLIPLIELRGEASANAMLLHLWDKGGWADNMVDAMREAIDVARRL